MSIKLLSEINDNYQKAVIFHKEQCDLFWFLSLPGFAALHEYQAVSENFTQRKLKKFIIDTCQNIVYDTIPEGANLLEPLTKGKNRRKISVADRKNIIIQSFSSYEKWEAEALDVYEKIAKELSTTGYIAAYRFVSELVEEVNEELGMVSNLIIAYQGTDWDMPFLTELQYDMSEQYEYKLRLLYKTYKKYHHFNSIEYGKFAEGNNND